MKNKLLLCLLLFSGFIAEAQIPLQTNKSVGIVFKRVGSDSMFYLPNRCDTLMDAGEKSYVRTGSTFFDTCNSVQWIFYNNRWNQIIGGGSPDLPGNWIGKSGSTFYWPGPVSADAYAKGASSGVPAYGFWLDSMYYVRLGTGVMEIYMQPEAQNDVKIGPKSDINYDSSFHWNMIEGTIRHKRLIIGGTDSLIFIGDVLTTTNDTATFKPFGISASGKVKRLTSWPGGPGGGADGNNYLTTVTYDATTRTITFNRNGLSPTTVIIPLATTADAGLLAAIDKRRIDSSHTHIDTIPFGNRKIYVWKNASGLEVFRDTSAKELVVQNGSGTGDTLAVVVNDSTLKIKRLEVTGAGVTKTVTAEKITLDISGGGGSVSSVGSGTSLLKSSTEVKSLLIGTSGSDFGVSAGTNELTFNLPTTSLTARGALASTDWQNIPGVLNMKRYGADATGAGDVSTIVSSAIAAGYKYLYFPSGSYLISNTITIGDSITIMGDGGARTQFKLTTNITGFYLNNSKKSVIKDLAFYGTYVGGATTAQKMIVLDSALNCSIINNHFENIGGYAITIDSNALVPAVNNYVMGNYVSGNNIMSSYGGVFCDVRGEYNRIAGNSVADCQFGVRIKAGNNLIYGNTLDANAYNIYVEGGAGLNDGHGVVSSNTLNHAGTANVYCTGLIEGMLFSDNMIYAGNITILNSDLVKFLGGHISATTITSTNNTNCSFTGVDFRNAPTWTVTGTQPGVYDFGSATTGLNIRDGANNKNFYISNNNSVVNIGATGGTGTDRIVFQNSIVGKTGTVANTRDITVGSFRMDKNSSDTDPFQIYNATGTGSVAAFLSDDVSGLYAVRIENNGRTGIFLNGAAPTAMMDFLGGTTTLAPLRLRSGVAPSSPNNGEIWYDGTDLLIRSTTSQTIATGSNTLTFTNKTWNGVAIGTAYGGAPSGGSAGQVLTKIDGTNYNYSWQNPNTNTYFPWDFASRDSATTSNAVATTLATITIDDNTRGIIEVRLEGINATAGLTGIKRVRWKKISGTLTLGTVEDEMAIERDGGLTTATFTISTSSNNIIIQVTGEASTTLDWKATYFMTQKFAAL